MARGYGMDEMRQNLIRIMGDSKTEMSGVELSRRLGISRITMAKYLALFEIGGLLRKRGIGNVTLWSLEPEQESFDFPDDYFKVAQMYLRFLTGNSEDQAFSLLRNCMDSGGVIRRLILEVIMPAVDSIRVMYDDGRIGTAERSLLETAISRSLHMLSHAQPAVQPEKNVVVIAADSQSRLVSEIASAAYRSDGWRVSHLGDMSMAINVLFDLDFQKLIRKVWRQKPGILIVAVFSHSVEGFSFFADSVKQIRSKSGRRIKLVLCGSLSDRFGHESDLLTERVEDVLQWSETVSGNLK